MIKIFLSILSFNMAACRPDITSIAQNLISHKLRVKFIKCQFLLDQSAQYECCNQASNELRMLKEQTFLAGNTTTIKAQATKKDKTLNTTKNIDWDLVLTHFEMNEVALEMGVFYLAVLACMMLLLNEVKGDSDQLWRWLLARKLNIFQNQDRNPARVQMLLKHTTYFYLGLPFIALVGWNGLLIWDYFFEKGVEILPIISTVCVTVAVFFGAWAIMIMVWDNYQMNTKTAILGFLCAALFTSYQGIQIFGYQLDEVFLPYTAFFFYVNYQFVQFGVFLWVYEKAPTVHKIVNKFFPEQDAPKKTSDYPDQQVDPLIKAQKEDPEFKLTKHELQEVITINKVNKTALDAALGKNDIQTYQSLNIGTRRIVLALIGIVASIPLAINAYTIQSYDIIGGKGSKLGWLMMITVILLDAFTYLTVTSQIFTTAPAICAQLIINRVLIIICGQDYWIYGCMLLYLIYGIILSFEMAAELFPVDSDPMMKRVPLLQTCAKCKYLFKKGFSAVILFVLLSLLFFFLVFILGNWKFTGNTIKKIIINGTKKDEFIKHNMVVNPTEATGICVAMIASLYAIVLCARAFLRRATRSTRTTGPKSDPGEILAQYRASVAKGETPSKECDFTIWLALVVWVTCSSWSFVFYRYLKDERILAWGIAGSASIIFFFRTLVFMSLNDFMYYEQIEERQQYIERHNKNVKDYFERIGELKKKIDSGEVNIDNWQDPQLRSVADLQIGTDREKKGTEISGEMTDKSIDDRQGGINNIQSSKVQRAVNEDNEAEQEQQEENEEFEDEDDIYMGGEALDANDIQLVLSEPKEEVDGDYIEVIPNGYIIMSQNKLKQIEGNWEKDGVNFFAALFGCKLRPNDYQFIISLVLSVGFWAILLVGLLAMANGNLGAISCMPLIYIFSCVIQLSSVIYQKRYFRTGEVILWAVLSLLYLSNGIGFVVKTYSGVWSNFTLDFKKRPPQQNMFSRFMLIYCLGVPLVSHAGVLLLTYIDRGTEADFMELKYFVIVCATCVLFMIIMAFAFLSIEGGCGFILASSYILFLASYIFQRLTKDKADIHKCYLITNRIFTFIIVIAGFAVQMFDSNIGSFMGISYTMAAMLIFVWAFAIFSIVKDHQERFYKPVYVSPNIIPIFKFDPEKNRLIRHAQPYLAFVAGFLILMVWVLFANSQVYPHWFGAFCSIAVIFLQILSVIELRSSPLERFKLDFVQFEEGDHQGDFKYLNDNLAKNAWLNAKLAYYNDNDVFEAEDVDSYAELWARLFNLRAFISLSEGNTPAEAPKGLHESVKRMINPGNGQDAKAFAQEQITNQYKGVNLNIQDINDLYNHEFVLQKKIDEAFLDELSMVANFITLCSMDVQQSIKDQETDYLTFIDARLDYFTCFGLHSIRPPGLSASSSSSWSGSAQKRHFVYDYMIQVVDNLGPEEKIIYDKIEAHYKAEIDYKKNASQRAKEQSEARNLARQEEALRKKKEKEEQIAAMNQKLAEQAERKKKETEQRRKDQLAAAAAAAAAGQKKPEPVPAPVAKKDDPLDDVDSDQDPNELPDSIEKYKTILKRARKGEGKFTDDKFDHNDPHGIIGSTVIRNNLDSRAPVFIRATESEVHENWRDGKGQTPKLFTDGVSCEDLDQGALGDCYFLSSMAVLGDKVTTMFYSVYGDPNAEWEETGAVCLIFWDCGNPEYVVIDDYLPTANQRDFSFVRSPSRAEMWPMLLEKAYAKKYGSYETIEGGLVDIALSELTNGIPETLNHVDHKNTKALWDKLYDSIKTGFLGAGSPSHPDGDRAISNMGITYGHAYSILDLKQVDSLKLIKLRNPWGRGEWKGAYSDKSDKWNTRLKNAVGFNPETDAKDDGIFWMEFEEYTREFECSYVCTDLANNDAWKLQGMDGEWEGKYAAGLPNAKNRNAVFHNNPQYGITLQKAGDLYFVFRLKERESPYRSKLYGYMNVQTAGRGGELIKRPDKNNTLGSTGPVNSATQSVKVTASADLQYPYTITCLLANMAGGEDGEGSFNLQVFSKDKSMSIKALN